MSEDKTLYFLIAGEASGDVLGARLMLALKDQTNGHVRFAGVGGPRMEAEGMTSLFPQSDLAHVGLVEVLKHIPSLVRRMRETAQAAINMKPAAIVTIDSPDFCFRVGKKIKSHAPNLPLIHYVAPSVWAWRPGRAKKIALFLDHLLALLPFEPPYFTKEGLDCSFVGHPLVESGASHGDAKRFCDTYHISQETPLLALLLGSRKKEIATLLPLFQETVSILQKQHKDLRLVMPTIPSLRTRVEEGTRYWENPPIITDSDQDKYDAFAASRAALACSGTISIELALARLPTVIAYKVSALTAFVIRRLIRVKFVTLLNIMQNKAVMPEFLQQDCEPKKLAEAVEKLLSDTPERQTQSQVLATIAPWLGEGQFVPSQKAAEIVRQVAQQAAIKNSSVSSQR